MVSFSTAKLSATARFIVEETRQWERGERIKAE
jgi:hypothetical protein